MNIKKHKDSSHWKVKGKAGDAWGGCPLFPGKQVNAKGWCSSYIKKA